MRLTLVQPPNGLYDRLELAPPLGLLSIAAVLEEDDVEVAVLDMNLHGMRDRDWLEGDFYREAVRAIVDSYPDVVGFTSMAVESHVCLEIARRLKSLDPHVVVILGGPHFSSIAREVLTLYPWVDYVITGEGELATRGLLRSLRRGMRSGRLENVAYRRGRDIALDRILKPMGSLNELPFPAFHLVDLEQYFQTNPGRLLNYEHGRGCVLRCAFCYSSVHWGQGEQVKRAERVADEVQRLHRKGARHLFFIQDNFPNSKAVAKSICGALAEADTGMRWNCYATLPQLVPDLLDDLAAAGCNSVFVGVDAVSSTSKRAFYKHYYKGWEKLAARLRNCLVRGIVPTCAFMIDTPSNGHRDTDEALVTALFARNLGCGIRLNTLTLYNQTATALALQGRDHTYTNLKPTLLLDTPSVTQDNPYAREHPALFPFHNTVLPLPVYTEFVTGMHLAYTLYRSFPRTLLQYILVDNGSLWNLIRYLLPLLGDLTRIGPLMRRPVERELFVREFPRLSLSRQTRATFELEHAELRLGRNELGRSVPVSTEEKVVTCRAGRYRVVGLPHHPARFDELAPLPPMRSPVKQYLLVRHDRRIRYFEMNGEARHAVDRIESSSRSGEPVGMSRALLDELLRAKVLTCYEDGGV